jgi:hypothetical protein
LVARQGKFERTKQARTYQLVRTGLLHLKMPSRCSGGEVLPFAPVVVEWSGRKKARQGGPVGERRDAGGPGWAGLFRDLDLLSHRPRASRCGPTGSEAPSPATSSPSRGSGSTATASPRPALRRHSFDLEVLGNCNMPQQQLTETNSVLFHQSIHNNLKLLVGFYLKAANNSCPRS